MTNTVVPYIPVDAPDELKEYAKSAIVKLTHTTFPVKGKDGTAFFVSYKSDSGEICHGLMTNHHVINFDHAEPIVDEDEYYEGNPPDRLTVSLSSEKLQFTSELKLDEASVSYAFSCSRLDVTLLEFSQEEVDRFTAKKVRFLEMERDVSASYGDCLHIYGHPGGGQLCKGEGRLVGQPTPLMCYSVDTAPGFSGSPIFKVIMVDRRNNTFRYQLVAIHHRAGDKDKYNCGTPICAVLQAIDRDRPFALHEEGRQYPRNQREDAKEDIFIKYLFGVDLSVAKGLDPPIDRVSVFDHVEYYGKPRFYKINSGTVEMTLSHSLEWDQFTLMDVLHSEHIAVPWRDFGLDEFKAFHKLAMGLERVCSLERSEHTASTIVESLEEHLQRVLDKVSLAVYYCRDGNNQHQMTTVQKLKWAVMCKDGPEHLAHALVQTRGIRLNEDLNTKLDHFKCKEATEVELIETTANCLTAITSQLRIIGHPPAPLKTHVQRTDAVDGLGSLLQKGLNDIAAVSVWGMGGLGKTHLVLDVVQSPVVQKVFPNLIWHEVGQLSDTTLEENIKKLAESIGADSGNYLENNINAIKRKLREPMFKDTLLVIDNVWSSDVAKNFLFDFPTVFTSRVRLLLDTNHRPTAYQVPSGFKWHQTAELLRKCTETNEKAPEMSELHSLCGGHPLVVAILARNIARKIQQGRNGWDVITELKTAGMKTAVLAKSEPINEQRHRNVLAMLRVIMETMEDEDRNCLHALWICKRGAKLTRNALRALWVDCVEDPDDEADYLCSQALLQEEQQNIFTIHDVIYDLITKTETTDADINCHKEFIHNFEIHICPLEQVPQQDTYMTTHCGYHIVKANLKERWVELFVHNVDFLEDVAGQGVDLLEEFSLAERLFSREERLKEKGDGAQQANNAVPQFAVPIYLASLYQKAKSKLKPQRNAHVAFMTGVSQILLLLVERHGNTSDSKRQNTQKIAISQITRMLSRVLFTDFRHQNDGLTSSDSKLALHLRAAEVVEQGLNLLSAIEGQAEPAEIQRLVSGMKLPSFFQTKRYGETCMHAAIKHEQPAVIFDILKNADVWKRQSTIEESSEMMDAVEGLKIAGIGALFDLYKNYEERLSSYPSHATTLLKILKTFTIEPRKHLLSTLTTKLNLLTMTENVVKVVLQSSVFQVHQFAIADTERWRTIERTNNCDDDTSSVFGLWFILTFFGIQSTLHHLCDNLPSKHKNDLSWKGFISAKSTPRKDTALILASLAGSVDTVKKLLTEARTFGEKYQQTYINHQGCTGWTALHAACSYGHLQVVNHLLDNSADLLLETRRNDTCLMMAARYDHYDVVESLLSYFSAKTDKRTVEQYLNRQDRNGWTALYWACCKRNIRTVNQLLRHSSALLLTETAENDTCLRRAVVEGYQDVVECLLTHLCEKTDQRAFDQYLNHQDSDGWTALYWACWNGNVEIITELLRHSSAVLLTETASNENESCLHLAAQNSRQDIMEILLTHLKNVTDQHRFEQHLNHQDSSGWTALHVACNNGHLPIVKQLLSHGAGLLQATRSGHLCLHMSAKRGHDDIVEVLIGHAKCVGGKRLQKNLISHQTNRGVTALQFADSRGYTKIADMLR